MADADRCVMCGAIIPEGRMVCPTCENKASITINEPKLIIQCPENCIHRKWRRQCVWCRRNPELQDYYERDRNRVRR